MERYPSNSSWFCNEPNDHPHGGGEGRALSVDHLQCHHGVNLRLVRKLVVVKIIRQTYRSWT